MKKRKKVPKPIFYWLFMGGSFLILMFTIGKTIVSAIYTLVIISFETPPQNPADSMIFLRLFPFSYQAVQSLLYILFIIVVTRFVSIFIVAQFVLPVANGKERWKAKKSLSAFINRKQTIAVFVKEGKLIESSEEADNSNGGVVLADLSSAITLSQQKDTESWNISDEGSDEKVESVNPILKLWKKKQNLFVDAKGPGLIFLEQGQKITNSFDLRPQFRKADITAYTRNGIQVTAQVSVTFCLSNAPDVISVGYVGTPNDMKWRWLDIDEDMLNNTITIRGDYELEPYDIPMLESYVKGDAEYYSDPEVSPSALDTPYKFYKERVFSASLSKARSTSSGKLVSWYEAPLETAIDVFRKELLAIPYDDLYVGLGANPMNTQDTVDQNGNSLIKLKDTFSRKMKLKGVVLFQYYVRADGKPFNAGDVLSFDQVIKYPVMSLPQHNFNSLRSVGVAVKEAGFSNIQPINKGIKKQIVDNWKARWKKEVSFIRAEHELETVRIQNRNRAQIQQEMTYLLSSIFQSSHTDEALALRVFQALESAVINHGTNNDMTSREIVDMLDSLHRWLLVDRKDLQAEKESIVDPNPENRNNKEQKKDD